MLVHEERLALLFACAKKAMGRFEEQPNGFDS
jgi:hypothetical protein